MRKLSHPHVVNFFGMERVDGKIYIMMEKVHGGELFDRIVARGSYTEADAALTMRQLCDGLAYVPRLPRRPLRPQTSSGLR